MRAVYIEVNCDSDFGGSLNSGLTERYKTKAKSEKEAIKKVKKYLIENTCLQDLGDDFDDYVWLSVVENATREINY